MTLQKQRSKFSRSSRKSKRKRDSIKQARPAHEVALSEVKDDFSRYLRLAAEDDIIITRHGQPAGVLIGFASEEDWFEYRLEHDPEFLQRVAEARADFRAGRGVPLEKID